jgi:hypothetical protein
MALSLQEMSDRMEIQDVMVAYCYAVDTRNWDALDDVFTPDAMIDYSEMVGFRGDVKQTKAFLAEGLGPIHRFQHSINTSQITIDGDTAHGRTVCYNPIVIKTEEGEHVMLMGLWYRDRFVRTPAGWRIQDRYEERCYQYNVPAGLLPE